ncbi:MAG: CcmD family protein [Thermoanaerobaculia bacterium]|nr:CcmD family protein [Thermoanaerobaculia bacterium]MCZ7651465.1 CcmD family protein [Thermoanaerobaculia bacterium]HSM51952.1 CcmD family protein [Thermoanaerobaculia bacterium]
MNDGTNWALVAVNLIIWSGIFLYLLRLQRQLDRTENDS